MPTLAMDLLVWMAVLAVTAGLLIGGWRWMQAHATPTEAAPSDGAMCLRTTPRPEGAPPTVAEQQAAFDRLAALPQFAHLQEGGLVHWGDGSVIDECDCRDPRYPVPHLRLTWPGGRGRQPKAVGLVGRAALEGLVRYHESLARPLVGALPSGVEKPER